MVWYLRRLPSDLDTATRVFGGPLYEIISCFKFWSKFVIYRYMRYSNNRLCQATCFQELISFFFIQYIKTVVSPWHYFDNDIYFFKDGICINSSFTDMHILNSSWSAGKAPPRACWCVLLRAQDLFMLNSSCICKPIPAQTFMCGLWACSREVKVHLCLQTDN